MRSFISAVATVTVTDAASAVVVKVDFVDG